MLVCHCKAVYETAVRAVIAAGARDEFDVADACGAGSQCGGCVPVVTSLLREQAREQQAGGRRSGRFDCMLADAVAHRTSAARTG